MNRNLLVTLILGIILLFAIGYYFVSTQQSRNALVVDADGAHVEIGEDGISVDVDNSDGSGMSIEAGSEGVRVEESSAE